MRIDFFKNLYLQVGTSPVDFLIDQWIFRQNASLCHINGMCDCLKPILTTFGLQFLTYKFSFTFQHTTGVECCRRGYLFTLPFHMPLHLPKSILNFSKYLLSFGNSFNKIVRGEINFVVPSCNEIYIPNQ